MQQSYSNVSLPAPNQSYSDSCDSESDASDVDHIFFDGSDCKNIHATVKAQYEVRTREIKVKWYYYSIIDAQQNVFFHQDCSWSAWSYIYNHNIMKSWGRLYKVQLTLTIVKLNSSQSGSGYVCMCVCMYVCIYKYIYIYILTV